MSTTPAPPPSQSAARAEEAVRALAGALAVPTHSGPSAGTWRFKVRGRVAALREALIELPGTDGDNWLAARGGSSFAERNDLMARLGALSREVLEHPDLEVAQRDAAALLDEVVAHLRRSTGPSTSAGPTPDAGAGA